MVFLKKLKKNTWTYHYQNVDMIYSSWDIEHNIRFLSSWFFFPLIDPENQNFEKKWKKCLEILSFYTYMCTINEDQFLKYNAADIIFFSFWTIFCAFTPLTTPKIKILKKLTKTPGDIIIWHKCIKNQDHMLHCSWDRCMTDIIFVFHFGLYFALTSLKT